MSHHEEEHKRSKAVAVAVITPSGIYPDDNDYRRAYSKEIVSEVLEKAATHLHLTNTSDWEAFVDNEPLDPQKSFEDSGLEGIVEIEWHKREGGGGA